MSYYLDEDYQIIETGLQVHISEFWIHTKDYKYTLFNAHTEGGPMAVINTGFVFIWEAKELKSIYELRITE